MYSPSRATSKKKPGKIAKLVCKVLLVSKRIFARIGPPTTPNNPADAQKLRDADVVQGYNDEDRRKRAAPGLRDYIRREKNQHVSTR